MKLYGLKFKKSGEIVRALPVYNRGNEYCLEFHYEIGYHGDLPWMTDLRETAERVANSSEPWYSAGYNSPVNPYLGQLEVVEFTSA